MSRKKSPQPSEDYADVVANCAHDGVGRTAFAPLEMAARWPSVFMWLRSRSTSQLAFDRAEAATPLAGDKGPVSIGCVVAAIAFVD